MKKLLTLLTMILIASMLLSCDMHNYTAEAPYICENGELTDEQARTIVDNAGALNSRGPRGPEDLGFNYCLSARVKKVSSTHYYWEENGLEGFYTDTTLQILEIFNEPENEYGEYSEGDTLRKLEFYSFDPDGNFLTVKDINGSTNSQRITFIGTNMCDYAYRPLSGRVPIYPYNDWNPPLTSFIKSDAEYIMVLDLKSLVESEQQRVYIEYPDGKVEIPYEELKGMYCYSFLLFEFSELAYDIAKIHFYGYENPLDERFTDLSNIYDQQVIYFWEEYGERVN